MLRLLLTLLVAAVFLLALWGMWRGWRHRQDRQAAVLVAFPAPPTGLGDPLLPEATGVYVGSTTAGDWQDRIAVGDVGHRAAAVLRLHPRGLLVDRTGASPLWIPADAVRDARTDRALAGKVMSADGLLVVRWQLGEHQLDTGFRGDDKDVYPAWVAALRALPRAEQDGEQEGTTR